MGLVEGYNTSSDSDSDTTQNKPIYEKKNNNFHKQHVSYEQPQENINKRKLQLTKSELKRRRKVRKGDGPWGSWSGSDEGAPDTNETQTEQQDAFMNMADEEDQDSDVVETDEISHFYGKSEKDYQGRGYLHPPSDIGVDLDKERMSFRCFLPKKVIRNYPGHADGTTALKFLPKTGHLVLSGGNDHIIKIWDFYHDHECLRDFRGHTKPIKALRFTEDGQSFLSSSFDRSVKIWDTETGKVKTKLHLKSTPADVESRPTNSHEFIVGLSNSKILHYDDRVSEKQGLVQIYDHHLSSILALKYFPDGSKFISSSEDKTVRIWENQINVPIKQISDTAQHSMPYLNVHPSHNYFCAQSMDNRIYSFSLKPKYKRHPKKIFKGHSSAGYGISLSFSSDGRYICSGDSKSRLFTWDWNTSRLLNSIKIPGNKPVTQVDWHPQETSKVICSGAAGKIYVCD
ncbi:cdc40p [Saccharomyces arboricola H-6]|uniref:Pre-mRNA-processing factor 17 n=1 Tax=Saccharomyces arboricola (strain H-6 / AS 2.3317 / CBS 10644) TaxID=1160507 RepID=J8LJK0_SACAR|nr:cdc40p [Saccharomyces arboricola H-6]